MSAIPKKKLCWNCEGSVSWQEEDCPYCGVYLKGPQIENSSYSHKKESHISALNPPYRLEQALSSGIPRSPFDSHDEEESEEDEEISTELKQIDPHSSPSSIMPLVLLLMGSLSFIFGLMLVLFAHDGVLTLHWNASYWYFYLLFALPLLATGWMALKRLDEDRF